MVTAVTSLAQNGLQAWLFQRITGLTLGLYLIYICIYLSLSVEMNYVTWHLLNTNLAIKIMNTITLFSLTYHAWIGVWTVTTDYIKKTWARLLSQILIILNLFICLLYGLYTIIGVI